MHRHCNTATPSRMSGFGMLEVLVALLILSVGILGMSQLQGVATKQNHNGYLRSQAVLLASNVIERMRANRQHADAYVIAMAANAPAGSSSRAASDLRIWLDNLARLLPAGDGAIQRHANGQGHTTYTVTVQYEATARHDTATGLNGFDTITVRLETEPGS